MANPSTVAVVHLGRGDRYATVLKRLALVFDEIQIVRPMTSAISVEALADDRRLRVGPDGRLQVIDFNYFRDVEGGLQLMSLGGELDEVVSALQASGIVSDCSSQLWELERDALYRDLRSTVISMGIEDSEWNVLTGTSFDDYRLDETLVRLDLLSEHGDDVVLWIVEEPPSVRNANVIVSASHLASRAQATPLFPDEYRPLLDYRYRQFAASLASAPAAVRAQFEELDSFRARFGEAVFSVANAVFSSDEVAARSIDEIIHFRREMDLARRRFVSHDLMEIAQLVEGNPWGRRAQDEIDRYVTGKLAGDVASYEAESLSTWERLHGALAVRVGSAAQASTVGGGVGGIVGAVLPHTSSWGMVLGGALAGVMKEAPGLVSDLVDAILAEREQRRSGIAYLANFSSP